MGRAANSRLLDLDEIARRGARRMLAEALQAEVQDYLDTARGEYDEQRRALVVRNGYANEREILLGAGSVLFSFRSRPGPKAGEASPASEKTPSTHSGE